MSLPKNRPLSTGQNGCCFQVPEVLESLADRSDHCAPVDRGKDVFFRYAAGTAATISPATPLQWASTSVAQTHKTGTDRAKVWTVHVWAHENQAVVEAGSPISFQGSRESLNSRPDGMDSQSSLLKARVRAHKSSGGMTRIFDVAQGVRFSICAAAVYIDVLYPTPGTTDPIKDYTLDGGLVVSSRFGVFLGPGEDDQNDTLTNTVTIPIPQGSADIPIFLPPGTKRVSMYQTVTGARVQPTWMLLRTDVAPFGPSLGFLEMPASRRIESALRPGGAGAILTGPADGTTDRLLTVAFELEI